MIIMNLYYDVKKNEGKRIMKILKVLLTFY